MPTVVKEIVLGAGIFNINGQPVGLTRGGGQFIVEREIRDIEADGDRGSVKGRQVIDKAIPKLSMNLLEMITDNMIKMYPGLKATTAAETGTIITGTGVSIIPDTDYTEVSFVGKTKSGKSVTITVKNAINLENIDWALQDKDEVIHKLTYTGCYDDLKPTEEPWSITYK